MEAILKEYHAQLIAQNQDSPAVTERNPTTAPSTPPTPHSIATKTKKKLRTREKIEKLVSDGAKNYPAYLKLVHTGDSDFSDDEMIERHIRSKRDEAKRDKEVTQIIDLNPVVPVLQTPSPGEEKKDPTKEQRLNTDEVLYDTEARSPEYDNAVNQSTEPVDPEERARQEAEWKEELAKLEDEIQTLRQVLSVKVLNASELKRKLGITPMVELRQDFKQGIQNIKDSDAYKKTNEKLTGLNARITSSGPYQKTSASLTSAGEKVSNSEAYKTTNEKVHQVSDKIASTEAYQKTNQALKTVGAKTAGAFTTAGAFASKKLGDMRNSTAFKSFEEKLGGAYSNVKMRVRGSKSENNFEEALNSSSLTEEQNGGSASYPTSPMTPDEKVPL